MAPRTGCFLLPLLFIALAKVILVDAKCGDPPQNCNVDATNLCVDCTSPGYVPNPADCTSYYLCKDTDTLIKPPFSCPDGEIFDETDLRCKTDGKCTLTCGNSGGDDCLYSCKGVTGVLKADLYDCSVYYQCSGVDPGVAGTCPADEPYFDGKKCGVDKSACCYCRPYCYNDEQGKYVEDPTDCRKFFYCLETDKVPTFGGACENGEHFDMHAKQCSSTVPCVTLCRNVVDKNGCIDPYTCQELGYFPKCKTQCLREYYHCAEVSDDYATPETCPDNLVFNPDTMTCIKSETCPYNYK